MNIITNKSQIDEHQAWIQMFKKICECIGLTKEELNKEKYTPMFAEIERWGWFNHERIETMKQFGEWKEEWNARGSFWEGD